MEVSGQLLSPAAVPLWKNLSTHWIGGWMAHIAGLDILETRKVCCHCWDSNPRLSNPHPSHYTNNPVPALKRAHWYLIYCLVESSHGLTNILTCKLMCTKLASQDRNFIVWIDLCQGFFEKKMILLCVPDVASKKQELW